MHSDWTRRCRAIADCDHSCMVENSWWIAEWGNPCRECGFDWSQAPEVVIAAVEELPDKFDAAARRAHRRRAGSRRGPWPTQLVGEGLRVPGGRQPAHLRRAPRRACSRARPPRWPRTTRTSWQPRATTRPCRCSRRSGRCGAAVATWASAGPRVTRPRSTPTSTRNVAELDRGRDPHVARPRTRCTTITTSRARCSSDRVDEARRARRRCCSSAPTRGSPRSSPRASKS